MDLIRFYIRKLITVIKGEVLVLPSRMVVAVFFLILLGLPIITQDPYLLRILILTSIFAIFAASWDLLSGFTGQMNFGHRSDEFWSCPFLWCRGLRGRIA
jgi:branched-chain amino acid transport system permease protein